MNDPAYPLTDDDELSLPHPHGFVASYYVTFVKGAGMRVRIVNVPGSSESRFREETNGIVCPCAPPTLYHFTTVDGSEVATYITMDSHEALVFMMNPGKLLGNPTSVTLLDADGGEIEVDILGMLAGPEVPLVPEGEFLASVFAECVDALSAAGANTDDFGTDRVKAAEVYGSTDAMFDDFQKLLEGESDA